jgi:RND family efflux transporter MFP subunit
MRRFVALVLAIFPLLAACGEEEAPPEVPVRAIKTFTVSERAGQQSRRIAGLTEAAVVTDLAFESAGRMTEINVDIGDRVENNQVVARLDPEPFELRISTSRGQLVDAQAKLTDAKAKFEQQKELYEQGFATKTAYDTAQANLNSAESNLQVAESQLKLAERDLERAILKAPFAGQVSEKYVERFTEVTAGQQIVQLSGDGETKVKSNVPEGLVQRLQPGQMVTVSFPTLNDALVEGRITQIGARATSTNSFPVTVVLEANELSLRSGLTVEVIFAFETEATGKAFLLPLGSLLPTTEEGKGYVFVFDAAESVVRRRTVQVLNVSGNDLEVTGDIAVGDIIAAAGVSFLVDGMKVKLLQTAAE